MLDIHYLREHTDTVKDNCQKRRAKVDIDHLLILDEKRRAMLGDIEALRAERKQTSKGKPSDADMKRLRAVGDKIKGLEAELGMVEVEYKELLLTVPNLTHPEAPVGGEEDFKIVYTNKKPVSFPFPPQDHESLMTALDLVDFERGAKVAGAKFYFYKKDMVRLNQALLQYGIEVVEKHGYKLMETPDLVRSEILDGSGFNPRGQESQIYKIEGHDLNLTGTAEITVLGYHAEEILDLAKGPLKYAALSHCFRTEAGAYGKASQGLYRVHQFTKLEMFVFCKPEESEQLHQELLSIEKEICDGLELPYRVIEIASGDLGGPAYRKFDIEAWMVMKNDYGEITSTSNCTDYQARRLNIKYRREDGKSDFVHTLNGTAVVSSRFPIAIVENFQQADGSILIPKVLQPYLGKQKIIKK